MKILSIKIVTGAASTDIVSLRTNLPDTLYPFDPTGLYIRFHTQPKKAEEYVREHFPGIPVEVINAKP